jgi:16S rRNA (guanine527-N7)-methyltransferase
MPEPDETTNPGSADEDEAAALEAVLRRSRDLGFLGPGPIGDHVAHAATFARALSAVGRSPEDQVSPRCLDLGTGGGVPGLLLAGRWPHARWTLLDSMARRTSILRDEIASLGWADRVTVLCERAEAAARQPDLRGAFDVVTSRSFGAPAVTAECGRGFLRTGGVLVVSDPPGGPGDRWPAAPLAALGFTILGHHHGCTVLLAAGEVPEEVPRSVGRPGKRPLF